MMQLYKIFSSPPLSLQPPPGVDTPLMDTAETVYISSLALLKVGNLLTNPITVKVRRVKNLDLSCLGVQ